MKHLIGCLVLGAVISAFAANKVVPAGTTLTIDSAADDYAVLVQEINDADCTVLEAGASIEFVLGNDVTLKITKPITSFDPVTKKVLATDVKIVKRGDGSLKLQSYGFKSGNNAMDYYANIEVNGGLVSLCDAMLTEGNIRVISVSLASGASFSTQDKGTFLVTSLTGTGTFNSLVRTKVLGTCVFEGKYLGTGELQCIGRIDLMGNENSIPGGFQTFRDYADRKPGVVGFFSPSSVNGSADFRTGSWSGEYLYLGDGNGDVFPNRIDVRNLKLDDKALEGSVLNAGAHGGFEITGGIRFSYGGYPSTHVYRTPGVWPFVFTGSNTVNAAVFSGKIEESYCKDGNVYVETMPYVFNFVKRGTGIWRINLNSKSTYSGPTDIEEGTLQIDTLAERGVNCALGLATHLYKPTYTNVYEDCGYAVSMGAADADGNPTEGVLEYCGTAAATCLNRPIAVRTKGRVTAALGAGNLDLSGFSAREDGATLTLDARAGAAHVARAIDDGSGNRRLSVVKDGAGQWTITGDNGFSGDLAVNGGKLKIFNPTGRKYTWFRYIIMETTYTNPENAEKYAEMSVEEKKITVLTQLGLYDKDGNRQNLGLKDAADARNIQPGECAYDPSFAQPSRIEASYPLSKLFVSKDSTTWNARFNNLTRTDPTTHPAILMRLPESAAEVTQYDAVLNYKPDHGCAGRNVVVARLEGSVDGEHWDPILAEHRYSLDFADNLWWVGKKARYQNEADEDHGKPGLPLTRTTTAYVAQTLPNVGFVSVATDASLVADGEIEFSKLRMDPAGAGVFDGVTFAESGTIDFGSKPTVPVPADFSRAKGLANLENWSVSIGGTLKPGWKVTASESGVTVLPSGLMLILR